MAAKASEASRCAASPSRHVSPALTSPPSLAPTMVLKAFAVLLALVPTLSLAAKPSANSRVDKFTALARKNGGVVQLNSALYDELTEAPRDFSVSVLLTAMGAQYKCAPCQCVWWCSPIDRGRC